MPVPKLYTDLEVHQAVVVGIGLSGGELPKVGVIEEALEVFRGNHGTPAPNYEHFRALLDRGEFKAAAGAHLSAAEMTAGDESARHALIGLLAVGMEVLGEIGHVGGVIDSLDSALRARGT